MNTVTLEHDYPAPAQDVWRVATDFDSLKEVMKGIVSFEGLPEGKVKEGQSLSVMVSLFGKLPAQPYWMEVLECDDAAMILRSSERGAGVKTWRHTLTVEALPTGSRLKDVIEIDAGWLTWAFSAWARFLYRKRHKPRLRLLKEMGSEVKIKS